LDTFDTLNTILAKGDAATGLENVIETLMTGSKDEVSTQYGLLAEALSYPDDYSSVSFRLNANARWADGQPVLPEDVIFSFEKYKALSPKAAIYYAHVTKAEKTGDREVTFSFDVTGNRELPSIVGQLSIVPKHWWEATGPDGKPRNIAETTLEPVMGSGPYKVASVVSGSKIRFERRPDYWGNQLNVKIGSHNFDAIEYTYFSDRDVEFEFFRSDNSDFWEENAAKRWATSYDFPAVTEGRVKRELLDNAYRSSGVMVGFIPNLRRDKFKDPLVREALTYAFDFEELNRTIFFDQYTRVNSYFFGTELASSGLPQGRELDILTELKDLVPARVFSQEYANPVAGDPARLRSNLKTAIDLFRKAGYELKNNRMTNAKTGQAFSFEILLNGPIIEKVALPFAKNLKLIGIDVSVRTVDPSQFTNRWRTRDYDVIYQGWNQSLNPGNEQAEYWGSKSAAIDGSQNFAGIADPAIDKLIDRIIFAPNRDDQIAATRALDRVLLANHYVIPSYTLRKSRIAYWNRLSRPDELPTYALGFPEIWWMNPAQ
jgi:microcin C transport system substrate-binding protein